MDYCFNSSTVPTSILHKYHFSIKQVYDETEPCSDYLLSVVSPLGFEYYFYADFFETLDSIVYEAFGFDHLEYYDCLKRRCKKNNLSFTDDELLVDACWLKIHLRAFCEELLVWRATA